MMGEQYINGVLVKRWNETNKMVETMNPNGTVASSAPMTTAESLAADAYIAANQLRLNRPALLTNMQQDFIDVQAVIDTANATINSSPASYIKTLARAIRRLERVELSRYDGTS